MGFRQEIEEEWEEKESRLKHAREMIKLADELEAPLHVKKRLQRKLNEAREAMGYHEGSLGGFRDL